MEQVAEELRRRKVKVTPQRLAIVDCLAAEHIHPSAEEIYDKLRPLYPSLALATVYNTLEVLVAAQVLSRLTIDAKRTNYEYGRPPHDHFWCRSCGRIWDLPAQRRQYPEVWQGHKIEKTERYCHGICKKCLTKNEKDKKKKGGK